MAAGGATWVVSPTGKNRVYPHQHGALFDEVAASTARLLTALHPRGTPRTREGEREKAKLKWAKREARIVSR